MRKQDLERFLKFCYFSRFLLDITYLYRFQKCWKFFFGKPICSFKQPNFCTFWEILLSQSFFKATFLRWNFSGFKNIQILFRKTQPFFLKKPIFKAMKKFVISVAFCSKIATCNDFLKCEVFSEKPSIFFQQKPLFERFEKFYSFRRNLQQSKLAIFGGFGKSEFFSRQTRPYF